MLRAEVSLKSLISYGCLANKFEIVVKMLFVSNQSWLELVALRVVKIKLSF